MGSFKARPRVQGYKFRVTTACLDYHKRAFAASGEGGGVVREERRLHFN